MFDFHVVLLDMHSTKVKEAIIANDDGSYTIFIEASLSREEQKKECYHALNHIYNNDFEKKNEDVNYLELMAHEIK